MASEPERLRARRPAEDGKQVTSAVRVEGEVGQRLRRAEVFEDGELASASLRTVLTE
jgi:hypothetical protein